MKKKLLITLGDSVTEGEGVYDSAILNKLLDEKGVSHEDVVLSDKEKDLFKEDFHKEGWPNRVGQKLGFDKVLNLGYRGTSNFSHLEIFLNRILPIISELKKEYNISLIWMLTELNRISHLTNEGTFYNIMPHLERSKIERGYFKLLVERKINLEQDFSYLLTMSEILFKFFEIEFLICSWSSSLKYLYDNYETDNFLTPKFSRIMPPNDPSYYSPICYHPNRKGYEYVANWIVKMVDNYHPNFRKGSFNRKMVWKHMGYIENRKITK